MKNLKVIFSIVALFLATNFLGAQHLSPPNLSSAIEVNITDFNSVSSIQAGINAARRQEEQDFGICSNAIANISMPSQAVWNSWNTDQKTLFLANDERRARGGVIYPQTQTGESISPIGPAGAVKGYPFSGVFKPVDDAAQWWADFTATNGVDGHCSDLAPADRRCPAERIASFGGSCTPHQGLENGMGGPGNRPNIQNDAWQSVLGWIYGGSGHRNGVLDQLTYKDDYGNPREEGYIGIGAAWTSAHGSRVYLKFGDTPSDEVYTANNCGTTQSWNALTSQQPGCTRYLAAVKTGYQAINAGGTYNVSFESSSCFKSIVPTVRIRMSVDGGTTFPNHLILADNISSNNTAATVNIPTGINTSNVVIKIESANASCFYFSDEVIRSYCTSSATEGPGYGPWSLKNFTLKDNQNNTIYTNTKNNVAAAYEDFTNDPPINLVAGATLNYSMEANAGWKKDFWIDKDNSGVFEVSERIKIVTSNTGTITIPSSLANGQYRLRVRLSGNHNSFRDNPCGNDKYGQIEDYQIVIGTTTGATPSAPAAPTAHAATNVAPFSFTANWASVANSTSYQIDISSNNFASFIVQNQTVTGTSFSIAELEPSENYQYRVRAVNATGTSGNSNVISLITLPEGD